MNNCFRRALRAARLRWVPQWELRGAPNRRYWLAQQSSTLGAGPFAQSLFSRYTTAPARSSEDDDEDDLVVVADKTVKHNMKRRVFHTAQQALLEYLHSTRGLCFQDAEHISKRSPVFVSKLLEMVKDALKEPADHSEGTVFRSKHKKLEMLDLRVSRALVLLFRYHPVNEFEPFLESIGIKPSEYDSLAPRGHMFLSDDAAILENYRILRNYGVAHNKIGRIYRDAREVFGFGENVLASKLHALEDLGFSKTSVIKIVTCSPVLLLRDLNDEVMILQWLDDLGIQRDWIGQFLSARQSYDWRKMVQVPQFFIELGFSKEATGKVIQKNPSFLLDGSARPLLAIVVTMLKAGSGKEDLSILFLDFPNVPPRNFVRNIQGGMKFLADIGASEEDIKKFVVSNASILGSAQMKKANSILKALCVGTKRLCKIIMQEPQELLKYTYGSRLSRLPSQDRHHEAFCAKVKFLKRIGFAEGSEDMKAVFKRLRGKGDELQERFEFLVKTGLDPEDVVKMIKLAPQVLNQKIDKLESKISFLVNESGYPLSTLLVFPQFLSFTMERTKSRILMYNWLRERGSVPTNPALSTLLTSSNKMFLKYTVKRHPMGPEVWEKIQREVDSTNDTHCTSDN